MKNAQEMETLVGIDADTTALKIASTRIQAAAHPGLQTHFVNNNFR